MATSQQQKSLSSPLMSHFHRASGPPRVWPALTNAPSIHHNSAGPFGHKLRMIDWLADLMLNAFGDSKHSVAYPGRIQKFLFERAENCDLGCRFCQNREMSKPDATDRVGDRASPEEVAESVSRVGCHSIAFPRLFPEESQYGLSRRLNKIGSRRLCAPALEEFCTRRGSSFDQFAKEVQ